MDLVRLLADGDRLRVFAAVALGHGTTAAIRDVSGLDARAVGTALSRLVDAGVVDEDKHGFHLLEHEIRLAARAEPEPEPADEHEGESRERARVLRAFFKDGRLQSIPASHAKRQVVLDVIAQDFEPGVRYSEKQVNLIIGKRFADTAAIRRYLVDDGFLAREGGGGRYWRAGGTYLPDRSE
jgi:hypothetical protein